jgi:hypothetical protein
MKQNRSFAGWLAAFVLLVPSMLNAGPPLICHAIQIGRAKSLPWTSDSWNLSGAETYDVHHLVADTLAILNTNTRVLVRMETLRRATLYAAKDPDVSRSLLVNLRNRAQAHSQDALTVFDFGYLVQAYQQANWIFKQGGVNRWHREEKPNPATGLDGYSSVLRAIALRGLDPEMEFAAALISLGSSDPERLGLPNNDAHRRQHAQKAIAGAKSDSLLAENLAVRFGGAKGEPVSEMLTQVETAKK